MNEEATNPRADERSDELAAEYDFDYTEARPNRFASRFPGGTRVVALEPDVASAFPTDESVNAALRGLIASRTL